MISFSQRYIEIRLPSIHGSKFINVHCDCMIKTMKPPAIYRLFVHVRIARLCSININN